MEKLFLAVGGAVGGAVVSVALGITGRMVGWCWEWLKRRTYTFETAEWNKHVRIPRIMVSRSVSTKDGTGIGNDEQTYIATGLKITEVPKGIELTRKALRVLNFKPGDHFSVEVNGVKYYFLVERIYDRLLTVKHRGDQGDAENGRRLVRAERGL